MTRAHAPFALIVAIAACGQRASAPAAGPAAPPPVAAADRLDPAALRTSVAAWDTAWAPARACLIGAPVRAADLGDAIEIGFLERGDGDSCYDLSEHLHAPLPVQHSTPAIERSWIALDRALRHLEFEDNAYAHDHGITAVRDVEDWSAALHRAAGLATAAATAPALPVATTQPFPHSDDGRAGLPHVIVLGHVLVATFDGSGRLALRAPDRAERVTYDEPSPASRPSAAWAITIADDGAYAGPPGGSDLPRVIAGQGLTPIAAVGEGARRFAVLDQWKPLTTIVARSDDSGAHWRVVARIVGEPRLLLGDDPGAIDLAWPDPKALHWLHLTAANDEVRAVVLPFAGDELESCVAGGALWYADRGGTIRWADGRATGALPAPVTRDRDDEYESPDASGFAACTRDAILVRTAHGVMRCGRAACDAEVALPRADQRDARAAMDLVTDGLVYARQSGHVIGLWRTGRAPAFVHVAGDDMLVGLVVWQETPWLLVDGNKGLRLAASAP